MSLLSEYNGLGFVGNADGGFQLLRMQELQPFLAPGSSLGFSVSASLDNNISFAVATCDLETGSTGYPFGTLKYDFTAKKSTYTRGPISSSSWSQYTAIMGSPFVNGWYVDGRAFSGLDSTYYTNNFGSTYSATNLTTEKPTSSFFDSGYGFYWDGTTYGFVSSTSTLRTTTNGTTFGSSPGTFAAPFFMGNNRSNYSGYWFGRITTPSTGYAYKTSAAASQTNVAGYYITAMSPNGRYLQRINSSSPYAEEYSQDGGASWTTFPAPSPAGSLNTSQTWGQNKRFCSNSGDNFLMTRSGNVFGFDFSTNTWVFCASLASPLGFTSGPKPRNFLIEGVESLFVAVESASQPPMYYIVDMPNLLA